MLSGYYPALGRDRAGFVTVAIDIPLHGPAPSNPFRIDGLERTFDLDVMPADGTMDSSGSSFIKLGNPITPRDNTRQAVVDLINLNATLMAGDIPNAGGGSINLNNSSFGVHFEHKSTSNLLI